MQQRTEGSTEIDYGIDVRSRHRPISADVAQFLITGCEEPSMQLVDRELPISGSRDGATGVAGRWMALAITSREPSAVTVTVTQSGRDVAGSVHFGPPAFDVTLPFAGRMTSATRLSATIGTGDGVVTFAGTLDEDGLTLEGPVVYAGRVLYTLQLTRR